MEINKNKVLFEKLSFIVHKIIGGLAFWITGSAILCYHQGILKNIHNLFIGLILDLAPLLIIGWYFTILDKNSQWKPFGKSSNFIGKAIFIGEFLLLTFLFGLLKVAIW